jgi:pyridoxal phosphate enzyme (YggS family)
MLSQENFIHNNILRIEARIAHASYLSGRRRETISLMAVSKFHPIESVMAAYRAGIRLFGENRVQEAHAKFSEKASIMPDASLDMIGTLQKNKINKALTVFDGIQSVDSIEALEAIFARLEGRSLPLRIFFELHTGEASKAGFPDTEEMLRACEVYQDFIESQKELGRIIHLCGLMTMAPFTSDQTEIRSSFRELAHAHRSVLDRFSFPDFCELSMGMSNDFEIAIEEGSTMVRIGTAIFGERLN